MNSRDTCPWLFISFKNSLKTDMSKYKCTIVLLLVAFMIVTCINPIYPEQQFLQHIGTVLLLLPLIIDVRKNKFGRASFIGLSLFTLLHIIGARYIYSYVPYDEAIQQIFGFSVNEMMGATRNHYDRVVHFSFGLLMLPLFCQIVQRKINCSAMVAIVMAWLLIQTGSLIYELFEWLLTIVMASDFAEDYNGQQGDMWDAQKDMALALCGSTITAILMAVRNKCHYMSFP